MASEVELLLNYQFTKKSWPNQSTFLALFFLERLKKNIKNQDLDQSPTKFKGKGRGKVQHRTGHEGPDGK
jgi:hypothetical protein